MQYKKIAVDLSEESLKEIDDIFGKRKRSYFIEQALEDELGLPHQKQLLVPKGS